MPQKTYHPLAYTHIGIFTSHPKRLINFYRNALGFKQEKVNQLPGTLIKQIFGIACACRMNVLSQGSIKIEIFSSKDQKFKKDNRLTQGLNHWGYFVKNKVDFARKLVKSGQRVKKIKRGEHFVYFTYDPDNNPIEIAEPR